MSSSLRPQQAVGVVGPEDQLAWQATRAQQAARPLLASAAGSRQQSLEMEAGWKQDRMQALPASTTSDAHTLTLRSAEQAVSARLLPPLLLLVIISYLDRTALSFASIQMSQDLGLTGSLYGLGSGAFFLAYAAGQIPSNFLLLRFGGPGWLAIICIAWGAAASAFALVRGPVSFVLLRMLLGLAESGAFPGTWYYISCFYPASRTTIPYTIIETGITVSQVIAAPIAAGLLMLDGTWGLRGWQILFLVEGLPALMLGCVIGSWLPRSIEHATFLSAQQKAALLRATSAGAAAAAAAAAAAVAGEASTAVGVLDSDGASSGGDVTVDVALRRDAWEQGESEADKLLLHHKRAGSGNPGGSGSSSSTGSPHAMTAARARLPFRAAAGASCHHDGSSRARSRDADGGGSSSSDGGGGCSDGGSGTAGLKQPGWREVWAVARNRVVLYAGSWRILHDIAGNGVLYWTPKIVEALLLAGAGVAAAAGVGERSSIEAAALQSGGNSTVAGSGPAPPAAAESAGSPGVQVVLLSAIPYAASSLVHVLNAWHSQRVGEAKLHIGLTWLVGAAAFLLLPLLAAGAFGGAAHAVAPGTSVVAFVLLTVAHIGVNGANGLQTGLVAACLAPDQKALALAMYNTIGCMGSFVGPLLIGVLHDITHGYSAAMWALGCCLAGAAGMVIIFKVH